MVLSRECWPAYIGRGAPRFASAACDAQVAFVDGVRCVPRLVPTSVSTGGQPAGLCGISRVDRSSAQPLSRWKSDIVRDLPRSVSSEAQALVLSHLSQRCDKQSRCNSRSHCLLGLAGSLRGVDAVRIHGRQMQTQSEVMAGRGGISVTL